jgi:Tetratricopeptide repeat
MQKGALKERLLAIAGNFINNTQLEEAHGLLIALLAYNPQDTAIRLLLAHVCREMGKLEPSARLLNEILAREPTHLAAQASLALTYFHQEDFAKAWPAFEVRFKLMEKPPLVSTMQNGVKQSKSLWDGEKSPRALLVMNEQGLGDSLQFVRFLPELVKRNIQTTFVAPKRLHHLFKHVAEGIDLRVQEEKGSLAVDAWLPLMELPARLKLDAKDYAAPQPYLSVNPAKQDMWRARLAAHPFLKEGFKIGLAWQGNPAHSADKARSCALEDFAPLAALPFVRLVCLQKNPNIACSFQDKLTHFDDLDSGENAFEDTAALVQQLDMVITVDTAIAHLAGGLGVPCALLLMRLGADWRWFAREKTTLWYKNHTLYRQKKQGGWAEPLAQICEDIRQQRLITSQTYPDVISPPLVPLVPQSLTLEGVEKLLRLEAKTNQSEDVGEITTLLHQRMALSEWVKAQNLSEETRETLTTSYSHLQQLRQNLAQHAPAKPYLHALENYEALKISQNNMPKNLPKNLP